MPLYEYYCAACDKIYDKLQKFSDPALENCPVCNSDNLQKLVSASRFKLTGNGWYETDFKNNNSVNKPSTVEASSKQDTSSSTTAA